MPKNNLIIIFTRNPELGKVKTRLAKTIGDESALNIYRFLLEHTEKVIRNIDSDKAVYYSVSIRSNDMWQDDLYLKYKQDGNDLGERMLNAFQNAFNDNYDKVIIVGSDLFDLEEKHIQSAFNALDNNDVVIGPAEDGGYYLLGMKTLHAKVFQNKQWGTETVFNDTIDDLKNESVFLLDELNDVDTYDDIKNNKTLKNFILQND
ncbi:TIGR04282 family arsenosugar biosynthesis glycosyltransferase [Winogradskyella sp. 3972H.M.0a.05]|uniref:TIGR04282 family arsenosugar biosynthesis glycosyltransferase n=1 Tax=Winogradskyella sp. 3972H.M.0a.05 TaxID=2950277 RepID=UPI003393FE9D